MQSRVILHVDMDAFYASIEQREHPEWRGLPVIVGSPPDRRGVVAAASYEARKFGVRSAMPSRQAGKLCPGGIFCPVNMSLYKQVSQKVFAILERFTPFVEPLSLDEAFLDVTGARGLFGTGIEIAHKIRRLIATELNLTASIGVASNKYLAKLASDLKKPDGLTVVPTEPEAIASFLSPLSVSRVRGIGSVTLKSLHRLGFNTIGDLQKASPTLLRQTLGATLALSLLDYSFGKDDTPVVAEAQRQSIGKEHTFTDDCEDADEVRKVLLALTEEVGGKLREENLLAAGVRLKLRWQNFKTITRQEKADSLFSDDAAIRHLILSLFDSLKIIAPIRLIGITVYGLSQQAEAQPVLPFAEDDFKLKQDSLSRSIDQIRQRYGADSLIVGGRL